MCGRYYINDDTAKEIEKLIRDVEKRQQVTSPTSEITLPTGDIHPADQAPVLMPTATGLRLVRQRWGFPGFSGMAGGQLVINARSESAMDKPLFRGSLESQRVVIPAAGFYEWNRQKEKNTFTHRSRPVLYLAGLYRRYENEDRFVILTTAANESMLPVHDRMPLILEEEEALSWLTDRSRIKGLLGKMPCPLERRTEYEQLTLF